MSNVAIQEKVQNMNNTRTLSFMTILSVLKALFSFVELIISEHNKNKNNDSK